MKIDYDWRNTPSELRTKLTFLNITLEDVFFWRDALKNAKSHELSNHEGHILLWLMIAEGMTRDEACAALELLFGNGRQCYACAETSDRAERAEDWDECAHCPVVWIDEFGTEYRECVGGWQRPAFTLYEQWESETDPERKKWLAKAIAWAEWKDE